MKKNMKKILLTFLCIVSAALSANAGFEESYNAGQQYLSQYQYSSAIVEFKRALRINYLDDSARIGLVNSYLARGTYFANNDKNWEASANDFRAALFYLKYYPSAQGAQNSIQAIANATENLNQCLSTQQFSTMASSRFQKAKALRADGNFAEAGYEFFQTLSDPSLKKNSLEQIADIMKVVGNDPKSAEYYQKAVALSPDDAGLRLKYARVLDKLGQSDVAVEEYNFALSRCQNDPEILYALERIYRQKLEQSPDEAGVMSSLGAILQKEGKYDEALQFYTKAGAINPSDVTTRLNVGTLYQQKQTYDAAIAAYDTILILYPDNVQANFYKSQCQAALGQKDAALAGFKKVLSLDPTNKDAKSQVFDIIKTTMSPSEMITYLQQYSDVNAADDMYDYALELHKQNKFDDAIASYLAVLKMKSTNPEVYVNLAIAYRQKNDLAQAIKTLQDAKVKFPSNKQVLDNLKAFVDEAASGKIDEAAKFFASTNYQQALTAYQAVQPPTFDSLSGMGACYKAMNDSAKAIEYYKKAYLMNQTNSEVAYYLGVLYSENEDWAQSKNYLKRAMTLDKNNTRAKDLYQTVLEQANIKLVDKAIELYDKADYAQSLKIVNQVISEDGKNSYAYYYRGLIFDVQKKYSLALMDYKKAILYSPDLTIINYLIALDYDNLTQYKNALTNYKKYVSVTAENNEYKQYAQTRIKELKKYEN